MYSVYCEIRDRIILCHAKRLYLIYLFIMKFASNSVPRFSNYFSVVSLKKGNKLHSNAISSII
jgi:hypothetical protein